MRKVTFGGANSLDNYFAREDHSVDWLMWSDEAGQIMKEFWKRIDTMLMGRITYEVALKRTKGADVFGGVKTYICSRTMKKAPKGAEVADDAVKLLRELKKQDGKEILIMGGGNLATSLFENDLIDEIGFNVHPVLLGSGIPLFYPMKKQVNLELIECKPFKNGCVHMLYRVKHGK